VLRLNCAVISRLAPWRRSRATLTVCCAKGEMARSFGARALWERSFESRLPSSTTLEESAEKLAPRGRKLASGAEAQTHAGRLNGATERRALPECARIRVCTQPVRGKNGCCAAGGRAALEDGPKFVTESAGLSRREPQRLRQGLRRTAGAIGSVARGRAHADRDRLRYHAVIGRRHLIVSGVKPVILRRGRQLGRSTGRKIDPGTYS
jgi:hypothetical protein